MTLRPIDHVIEGLRKAGFVGRPSDIGIEFPEGFAIWSMGSLTLADVDASASDEDERLVVEGVSAGAPTYFGPNHPHPPRFGRVKDARLPPRGCGRAALGSASTASGSVDLSGHT